MGERATMPPAVEALYSSLRDAEATLRELEASDPDEDHGSLLVGLRDLVGYAAGVLAASYGPDARYTVQKAHGVSAAAAHILNDADVLRDRPREGASREGGPHARRGRP